MNIDPFRSRYDKPTSIGAAVRHASYPALVGAAASHGTVRISGPVADWFKQAFEDIGQFFQDLLDTILEVWEEIKDVWDEIATWIIEGPLLHIVAGLCCLVPGLQPVAIAIEGALWAIHGAMEAVDAVADEVSKAREAVNQVSELATGSLPNPEAILSTVDRRYISSDVSDEDLVSLARDEPARAFRFAREVWRAMAASDDAEARTNGRLKLLQTSLQQRILTDAPHAIAFSLSQLVADRSIPIELVATSICLTDLMTPASSASDLHRDWQIAAETLRNQGIANPSPGAISLRLSLNQKTKRSPNLMLQRIESLSRWLDGDGMLSEHQIAVCEQYGMSQRELEQRKYMSRGPTAAQIEHRAALLRVYEAADEDRQAEMRQLYRDSPSLLADMYAVTKQKGIPMPAPRVDFVPREPIAYSSELRRHASEIWSAWGSLSPAQREAQWPGYLAKQAQWRDTPAATRGRLEARYSAWNFRRAAELLKGIHEREEQRLQDNADAAFQAQLAAEGNDSFDVPDELPARQSVVLDDGTVVLGWFELAPVGFDGLRVAAGNTETGIWRRAL